MMLNGKPLVLTEDGTLPEMQKWLLDDRLRQYSDSLRSFLVARGRKLV